MVKVKEKYIGKDYVPLSEKDVSHALTILVKQVDKKEIEIIEKREIKKKIKSMDKKEKYTLILCEKPQAAEKIANALGKPKKLYENKVSYYELERENKKIIVAAAVGHLFTITQKEKQSGYPIFNIGWQPNYKVKKADFTKKYYSLLASLSKNAETFIVATDYDIEGEVIGLNIIRFICKQKDANRMKFSSLTKEELENAYKNTSKTLNWGQAIAGETRHYLDWMYGINLSRALMTAIKKAGSFRIMSIGRVQGPALKLIVEREIAIQKFKRKRSRSKNRKNSTAYTATISI